MRSIIRFGGHCAGLNCSINDPVNPFFQRRQTITPKDVFGVGSGFGGIENNFDLFEKREINKR
jgi:hypothetical protein